MKKLIVLFLLVTFNSYASDAVPEMNDKNGYVAPFKMFDNVYYVGDKWVSSYAIETSEGLVIIDTLDFPYSKWIPINLSKLGLDDKKVTHIFVTHGHSDHAGGAQYLQSHYGAKVLMTKSGHDLVIEQSRKSHGINSFLPPRVDVVVHDNMVLRLGEETFTFYTTPGHTAGDYSIDFFVKDKGVAHRAFVVGGHSINAKNSKLAKQFFESMDRIRTIASQPPAVTVNLANHPHKNDLFLNHKKQSADPAKNPFISNSDFFDFLSKQEELAREKVNELSSK